MPSFDLTKASVPLGVAVSIVLATGSIIWYVSMVKLEMVREISDVRQDVAVLSQQIKDGFHQKDATISVK